MPYWMMENLMLEEGAEVTVTNVTLKKGTYVELQPHETTFIDLSNPKAILENELTNYSCLMKGETININYQGRDFLIDVVECKPSDSICVVEADLLLEFKAPHDYEEIPLKKTQSNLKLEEDKKVKELIAKENFQEQYVRPDGKKLTTKQQKMLVEKKLKDDEKKDDNFDPRQHRLKHGIKNY